MQARLTFSAKLNKQDWLWSDQLRYGYAAMLTHAGCTPPKPSQALARSNQEGNWTCANGDTDMEMANGNSPDALRTD